MCLSHVVYSRPFGCDTTSLIPRWLKSHLLPEGDVTQDDSQRRFLAALQNLLALQHCCDIVSKGYNIVPTLQLSVALKSSRVTSPSGGMSCSIFLNATDFT